MATDYDKEIDSILSDLDTLHDTKVDAVNGKQLSTNDFTNEHLRKVNRIETKEYQQEIVSGVTKELERTNDNHVRLADEFHRHLYGQDGVDAKFRKEIQDNLNYMGTLVKSANDRMNEIWQNWDEIVKEDQNHELRLQQVEGKTLTHDALIDSNTSEILNIQGEQVIQNNQIKEMQDKNVELETRVVDVEVSDADQNHRLDIAENRIGTFTDRMTALEDGYAQRDARMDGLDAQVSRYTERMLALELNEKAQNDRIKAEEEKNKRQDIDIACLYAEAKDRTITLDTEGTAVELQNSREGFVTINSIEGNTMVNCNKDVDKELTLLTSTVDVSSDNNVTLTEGVVDGGKVDVYLEGNTLVNVSKTKEDTPITHESEDVTGNHIALADEGSIRPVLNGNTLVNVCDQKDPIAITKSYTVETGNHVALQGEYDGKCRPVVTGNTLVNVVKDYSFGFSNASRVDEQYVKLQHGTDENSCNITMPYGNCLYKPSTTYTLVVDIKENTSSARLGVSNIGSVISSFSSVAIGKEVGRHFITFNTKSDFSTDCKGVNAPVNDIYFCSWDKGGDGTNHIIFRFFILEGDYTNKPIPEYFEGLKSSFEDKVVPENILGEIQNQVGDYQETYHLTKQVNPNSVYTAFIDLSYNNSGNSSAWLGFLNSGNSDWAGKYIGLANGINRVLVTPTDSGSTRFRVGAPGGLQINAIYLVKGDYTNYDFSEYDPTKAGKYKVDYVISREDGTVGQTKIFYLNSPLLEGDTIEQQGDNVVHVHRYREVVLDGSDDEGWAFNPTGYAYIGLKNWKNYPKVFVYGLSSSEYLSGEIGFGIFYSDKFSNTESEFRQYLQQNPVTVVYELKTPQYEVISQNGTILCDSYTNGHLDVDSAVPIERVTFLNKSFSLRYMYPSTNYILQLESDNVGQITVHLAGANSISSSIVKGLNKLSITTKETVYNTLTINGIGFNASNIVVTPAIEQDFDYFSGMQSCFEDNLVTEGENAGKYRVEYKVSDSEGVEQYTKTLYLNSPLLKGDTIEEKDGNIYHVHRYNKVVLDGNYSSNVHIERFQHDMADEDGNTLSIVRVTFKFNDTIILDWSSSPKCSKYAINDRFISYDDMVEANSLNSEFFMKWDSNYFALNLFKTKLNTLDEVGLNEYLQQNPITVIYELASPQYEVIQQDTIVMPTYSAGHLDVTTAVPVDKVNFLHFEEELTYLYPSTSYAVQFTSDNAITVDITLGGTQLLAQSIVKGLNKITITTPETLTDNKLIIDGVNANISEVVVTDTNREFGYFEGMKSVGECEDLEVVSRNKYYVSSLNESSDPKPMYNLTSSLFYKIEPYLKYFNLVDGYSLCNNLYDYYHVNKVNIWINLGTFNKDKALELLNRRIAECEGKINTQTLTHEPLRSVGEIKDKYVLIDGKWYIERNCAEVVFDGSDDERWMLWHIDSERIERFYATLPTYGSSTVICDKFIESSGIDSEHIRIGGSNYSELLLHIYKSKATTLAELRIWLQSNPVTVAYKLTTPTYEPIDYNPFEVYNEVTHISANSTIPCNVTVKNHGYNCILKPSTTYTVVSNQGVQNMTTPATLGDSLRFSGNGVLKDVMILEGTLSDNQIPGFFAGMESCYEQHKITDEYDEHFGYYEVNAKVVGKNLLNQNSGVYNSFYGSKTICFPVFPNTKYTYSSSPYEGSVTIHECTKAYSNEDAPAIGLEHVVESYEIKSGTTFTTSNRTKYVFMNYDSESDIQVEQGDTATEYEPYKESNIKFYIKDPLRGIGDVKDKVFVEDGKVKILRNCASVTLDGSENNWREYEDVNGGLSHTIGYFTEMNNIYYSGSIKNLVCDNLPAGVYDLKDTEGCKLGGSPHIHLYVSRAKLQTQDIEGFKQYLQQNPVTVVYQLAEPFIEEVDYNGIRLSQVIWDKSTMFFDTNIPSSANISYSVSTPILDQVAEVSSITDDQDALIIDMATQLAVLNMTL